MTPTAGAMTDAEPAPARLHGVRLDDGEIVLLALRQHLSSPAVSGGAPSVLLIAFLATLTLGRSAPMPADWLGVLSALAITPFIAALFRHASRRYVLTDRRVIVRHGRECRWVALGAIHSIDASVLGGRPGDVTFRSAHGVLLWPRVPDAEGAARAASEAVDRYARG